MNLTYHATGSKRSLGIWRGPNERTSKRSMVIISESVHPRSLDFANQRNLSPLNTDDFLGNVENRFLVQFPLPASS